MNNIILHIPHSSLILPNHFLNNKFNIPLDEINAFNKNITDLFTNELFPTSKYKSIVFPYSRIFCDVEKFANDELESMSKYGMGVIYTHTHKKKCFFNSTDKYKQEILTKFYYPYHKNFEKQVNALLKTANTILIDCHSFSSDIVMTEVNKNNLPDICIGVNNDFSTSKTLTDFVQSYFENLGYSTSINFPYSGTMLPNNIESTTHNLYSIMIEINKRIYLENNIKSAQFEKLKNEIETLVEEIKILNL